MRSIIGMMSSYNALERQLNEQAYAVVPFSVTKAEMQRAIDVFLAFLALPLETKERAYFKIRPEGRGSEVGYKRYRRDEGQTDNREYFHYHRFAEERFAAARIEIPELDALLRVMKPIYDAAAQAFERALLSFEPNFPGIHQKFFSETQPGDFYLRFLAYDRAASGEFLAKGHYDRGCCTLALAESAPGLRIGKDNQHLAPVVHQEGQALFFPGLKFPDATSSAFVPAWHDVVQKGRDAYDDRVARWAIVFFADPAEMSAASYEDAHTSRETLA